MAEEQLQPDGSIPQKPTLVQTLLAAVLGMIAVKIATYVVTTVWRLVTREDPPQIDMDVAPGKKAAWVALIGAATGAARQVARDKVKPPTAGAA
ncbi:MAG: hypothetical protein QOG54_1506 [Actinomycetota bacterium]|jgi:hypothetical protein|nr:hypothetical protein [Actinomycetota bacterium]